MSPAPKPISLTRFLIERGADPRERDNEDKRPIDYAIQNKHPQTTAVLKQLTPTDPPRPKPLN